MTTMSLRLGKTYVDKNETFIDIDNLKWNSTDIILSSSEKVNVLKDVKFRMQIFLDASYGQHMKIKVGSIQKII